MKRTAQATNEHVGRSLGVVATDWDGCSLVALELRRPGQDVLLTARKYPGRGRAREAGWVDGTVSCVVETTRPSCAVKLGSWEMCTCLPT